MLQLYSCQHGQPQLLYEFFVVVPIEYGLVDFATMETGTVDEYHSEFLIPLMSQLFQPISHLAQAQDSSSETLRCITQWWLHIEDNRKENWGNFPWMHLGQIVRGASIDLEKLVACSGMMRSTTCSDKCPKC